MESLEVLNKRLIEHFGVDSEDGQPQFRIVWSNDQTEKRLVAYTDSGVQLLHPEIREVKKYNYIKNMYVLERYVLVEEPELPGIKKSYEPIWVFRDVNHNSLPPNWEVSKIVIDVLFAALGKKSLVKYVEGDELEEKAKRVDKIQEELFGDENDTTDALAYKEGVVVPRNYEKES
jgi:hypothetical protein